ncbi:MAG: hypothetical protein HQK53_17835 [Oligoflexia bacterium]|nr:hypothetical protein [Oligoflexia bacterium]
MKILFCLSLFFTALLPANAHSRCPYAWYIGDWLCDNDRMALTWKFAEGTCDFAEGTLKTLYGSTIARFKSTGAYFDDSYIQMEVLDFNVLFDSRGTGYIKGLFRADKEIHTNRGGTITSFVFKQTEEEGYFRGDFRCRAPVW